MQRTLLLVALCAGFLATSPPAAAGIDPGVPAVQNADDERQPESIDLNTASAAALEALPGVGPRTAQLIVEYREEHGGFEKVEDLMNIRGIGEKTFLRLRPLVRVGAPDGQPDPR